MAYIAPDLVITPATNQPEAWREELKRVVTFLKRNDVEAFKLWDVLSAFRGPDDRANSPEDVERIEKVKEATTAVIRHAAGLTGKSCVLINDDAERLVEVRRALGTEGYSHFRSHAKMAFEALGLEWFENNAAEQTEVTPNCI